LRCYRVTADNSEDNSGKTGSNSDGNGENSARLIQPQDGIGFGDGRMIHGRSDDMIERMIESSAMPEDSEAEEQASASVRGRPFATGAPGDRLPGADRPTRSVILDEAYRLVSVQEGDEVFMIPAHRAVFRALTAKALKGSEIAQRRWTEMVQRAELEQMHDQLAIYNLMERPPLGREKGTYEDDILIDSRSGTVVIRAVGDGEDGQ
jgi:hypothetical protein